MRPDPNALSQTRTVQKYDGNGHLRDVVDPDKPNSEITRGFVNDANGIVLFAYQSTDASHDSTPNIQRQLVVNGQVLGRYGEMISDKDPRTGDNKLNFVARKEFNFSYAPVGDRYPATTPRTYVVGQGDTLQSIARAVYGDAGQWYLIAEANGLGSGSELTLGLMLRIPPLAQGGANNSTSFKLYDPSQIVGDTSPTLQLPPSQQSGKKKKKKWYESFDPFNGRDPRDHLEAVVKLSANPLNSNNWEKAFNTAPESLQWKAKAYTLPNPRNVAKRIHYSPGRSYVDQEVLDNPTLYQIGRTAATIVSSIFSFGFGWGGAAWDAYYAWLQTGSVSKGAKAGAPGIVTAAVTWGMNYGFDYMAQGASSAATGTTISAASNGLQSTWYTEAASSMIGEAAGQHTAMALGQQEHFNWRGVAAAGVMTLISPSNSFSGGFSWGGLAKAFVGGLAANAVGQIIREDSASNLKWGNLAISAAGSTVSQWVGASRQRAAMEEMRANNRSLLNAVETAIDPAHYQPYGYWPDQTEAETARLNRLGNPFAHWPDQTEAEGARLDRLGNPFAHWPDETAAEGRRLNQYEKKAVAAERRALAARGAQQKLAFSDGLDSRDLREGFAYQSRKGIELRKFEAQTDYKAKRANGPKMSALDGDGRQPYQRFLDSSGHLYASPLGSGAYAIATLAGTPDDTARKLGAIGNTIEVLAGALTGGGLARARTIQPAGNEKFNPSVDSYINLGKQDRHLLGTAANMTKGGSYFNSASDAQDVLIAYQRGQATIVGRGGDGGHIVRFDGVTGFNNNPGAGYVAQPTNIFWIKGTNSVSVVPVSPSKANGK